MIDFDAIAVSLQATRPKPGDRDGGRQWFYDVKAVIRALRSQRLAGALLFDAERFVSIAGYTPELGKDWGVE